VVLAIVLAISAQDSRRNESRIEEAEY